MAFSANLAVISATMISPAPKRSELTSSFTSCSFTFVVFSQSIGNRDMKLSGRQLAIMRVLWELGEATVSEVQESLAADPPLAYSTVATVLTRMEKKGMVSHRTEDRQFVFRAIISKDDAGQSLVGDLVNRVFGGSPAELVNHLLESDQVDKRELERIKKLVNQRATETRRKR